MKGLKGFNDGELAFSEQGDPIGPTGEDISGGESVEEIALEGTAAVSDGIDFQIAWAGDIGVESSNGDHGFKETPWTGRGIEAAAELSFVNLKSPVELTGANRQKFLFRGPVQVETFARGGEPKRDSFFKALAADIPTGFPDVPGDLQDPRLIKPRTTPVQTWESFNGFRLSQKSKGMFSVVVADLAEFIQDAAFLIFIRLMVTVIDGFEVLHT